MEQEVELIKEVYGASTYRKVVDTEFSQLITREEPDEDEITVDKLFRLYDNLFYQIPLIGDSPSHEYLIKRSQEYLGGSVLTNNEKALIEEINTLRQQLLEANKSLTDIAKLA